MNRPEIPALPPPAIADAQRAAIAAAEGEALVPGTVAAERVAEIAAAERVEAFASDRPGLAWWPGRGLEVGPGLVQRADLLHVLAHAGVDPAMPAHGAEFAAALLELHARHASGAAAQRLEAAMDSRGVFRTTESRIARSRRTAVTAVNREPGVLSRVVLADPVETMVCRVWEVAPDALVVEGAGSARSSLPLERLRYYSFRHKEDDA